VFCFPRLATHGRPYADAKVERRAREARRSNCLVLARTGVPSGFDELEKVGVQDVRVGGQHAVREASVCLQRTVREQIDRAGH